MALTLDHVTKSLAPWLRAIIMGCSITSSGRLDEAIDSVERRHAPGSLEVWDDSLCTVECLLVHGLEIGLHV